MKPTFIRLVSRFSLPLAILGGVMAAHAPTAARTNPADESELVGNYLAAYVAAKSRDMRSAAFYYQQTMLEDPRNQEIKARTFATLIADGKLDEAFKIARTIRPKENNYKFAQFTLSVNNFKLGRYAEARAYMKRITSSSPARMKAILQGIWSEARAVEQKQDILVSLLLTSWSYAGSKDQKRALALLDAILPLEKGTPFAMILNYHSGLIAAMLGNREEALKRLEAAYRADRKTLRVIDAYGRILSQQGDQTGALNVYKDFERLFPNHPIVADALKRLRAGETLPLPFQTAQQGASEVLFSLRPLDRESGSEWTSIIYLRLASYLHPEEPLAILSLSDYLEQLKQYESSIELLDTVPRSSPMRTTAEVQRGFALESLKRGDEAEASLKQTMAAYPDDLEAISALGSVLRSRQHWGEAADVYSKAIDKIGTPTSRHWSLFFFRGTCYERTKDWQKAETDLQKALDLVPEGQRSARATVLNYLAYSWVDRGMNIDPAFKMLQEAVELSPRDGMIIDSLGWAFYRLGRYDDAVRELERAVTLKPGDPVINDHLGDAYWKVGRKTEAQFQWQHAKDAKPEAEDLARIEKKLASGLDAIEEQPGPDNAKPAPQGTDNQTQDASSSAPPAPSGNVQPPSPGGTQQGGSGN